MSLPNPLEHRQHVKSDWHNYNLKQKIRGGSSVTENEFEKLLDDMDESLSGSGAESSDSEDGETKREDMLNSLLRKQARLSEKAVDGDDMVPKKRRRGAGRHPMVWFASQLLPENTYLGIYRALFDDVREDAGDFVTILRDKQLRPVPAKPPRPDDMNGVPLPSTMTSPSVFMCMVGGGHFAGMIVSLAPKVVKQASGSEQRQAIVLAHKTFHRYTTRRKQGGGQSANDAAKGAAHSAGSSLRRYNEAALEQEIRSLLSEWREMISNVQHIFIRANGSQNRRILFGPYDGQVLHHNDARNRTFPFSTRRATQSELMRAFVELTRVKVSHIDTAALAAQAASEAPPSNQAKPAPTSSKPIPDKPSTEEEEALLHTSQIQALIRRSKAPALLTYLTKNSLSPNFPFHPPNAQTNYHAPTPIHLAASTNVTAIVAALLTKAGADPTIPNADGKLPFDLSASRATRDAFRLARHELGEDRWDWSKAHVPPGLTKEEADQRAERERVEAEKAEVERRKVEEERLRREGPKVPETGRKGKALGGGEVAKTAEERREEEGRGLTEEMKRKMERERRARAAEARLGKLGGGGGGR